jgi:hypothetical protein
MLTWDAGRCASCGSPCNPSYRLCTTCDPAGFSKEPAVGLIVVIDRGADPSGPLHSDGMKRGGEGRTPSTKL